MAKVTLKPQTCLYPAPAVMVSCRPLDRPNIITLAWVGTVCSNPPMLSISIRPSRYSHGLVKQYGEFVVNLPTADLTRVTDYCGMVSGRKVDKFAAAGLTPLPAKAIGTVIIAECPVNIECRVKRVLSLGTHDLFLSEVVAVQADEHVLNERKDIDLSKARPLAYGSHGYWAVQDLLGTFGFSAKT